MTRVAESGNPAGPTVLSKPHEIRRAVLSSYLGNTIEFYDFLLYGTATAVVFNRIFFSNLDPVLGTIVGFGTFAAGYLARPIGGILFGHFGDKIGRKSVLIMTMTIMGVASGLIGVLPTYAQAGALAPVLLLVLRLLQGLAVGGEWGGASLMTAEHSKAGRRGLMGSIGQMGLPSGAILASVAITLVISLPPEQLLSWGWRVPFLASFVLLAIGLYMRIRVSESPIFVARMDAEKPLRVPIAALLKRYPAQVIRGCLVGVSVLAISSLFGAFMISYAVMAGRFAQPTALLSVVVGSASALVFFPLFAALSDRVGRRPVFVGGAIAAAALAFPAFAMVGSGQAPLLFLTQVIYLGAISGAMSGPLVAILAEMFGTEVRYSGLSVSYQVATVLGGGFAPLIAATLVAGGNPAVTIPIYLIAMSIVSAIAMLTARESKARDLEQV